eukprot:s1152_g14.t1
MFAKWLPVDVLVELAPFLQEQGLAGPPRHKAHLAPANSYHYDRLESLRLFDDCLQDICNRGLRADLPIRASVILDEMYQRDSHFRICDTPFRDFSELLDEAADEGLVKVNRRGTQEYISEDWGMFPAVVTPQCLEGRSMFAQWPRSSMRSDAQWAKSSGATGIISCSRGPSASHWFQCCG